MSGMSGMSVAASQKAADLAAHRGGKDFAHDFSPMGPDISRAGRLAEDGVDPARPWPPYQDLRSVRPTNFPSNLPVKVFRMTLDEDMGRYVWSINNKALSPDDEIRVRKGEVVRLILINRSMMHHPMHLHGHFFRVLNGQGDYAPLKHTVDVEPMSTTVIEFLADEQGDWFFHCHLLYHMMSGMARVVHYRGFRPSPEVAATRDMLYMDPWYAWARADVLSSMTQGYVTASDRDNILTARWEAGWQGIARAAADWEWIASYDRYFNRFFSVFAGGDFLGNGRQAVDKARGVLGLRYLLPLLVDSSAWIDSDGGFRANLDKHLALTPRLSATEEVEYDSHQFWKGVTGLDYLLSESLSLEAQYHTQYGFGAGIRWRF